MSISESTLLEMRKCIYDPNLVQIKNLELLTKGLESTLDIPDPTSPFMFLLENNALNTTAAVQEISSNLRKNYPELATTKLDLYNHVNTSEIDEYFSKPSTAEFNIYFNKKDLLSFGETVNGNTTITIPKYSSILVNDITFTLINDVQLTIYSNNKIFTKYIHNELAISYNVDRAATSTIVTDSNGLEWVMVSITFHQLKRYSFRETLMQSESFKSTINFDTNNNYSYIDVKSINSLTKSIVTLDKTYSSFVYNVNKPTIIIKPNDNSIDLEIPIVYNLNNLISTYLDITVFTTLGVLDIPLSHYEVSDFVFTMEIPATTDATIIGISNISTFANSDDFTVGGVAELSFVDLKNKIINYSTGDNNLPITINEVKDTLLKNDFTFIGIEKSLLESKILATRYIGKLNNKVTATFDDINTELKFMINDVNSVNCIKNDTSIVFNPYQMFSFKDGTMRIVNDTEQAEILSIIEKKPSDYNNYKLFFNLFKYVLDYGNHLKTRIYDVNQSKVTNPYTKYVNTDLATTFNITTRSLIFLKDSYSLRIAIDITPELATLNIDRLYSQLSLKLLNNDIMYFKGTSAIVNNQIVITTTIPIDGYINDEHYFITETPDGPVKRNYLSILNKGTLDIYSTDTSISKYNTISIDDIIIDNSTCIFYKETLSLEFATYLKHLYTNYKIEYTPRKYLKYTEIEYLTYNKNVYKLDKDGLIETTPVVDEDGNTNDVVMTVLHEEGSYVLDGNGEKIILHNIGDTILDENDSPIIDKDIGIIHKVNMFLLEDIFLRVNEPTYNKYRIDYFLKITDTLKEDILPINDNLLENTALLYKSHNTDSPVELKFNNIISAYDNYISPTITLYTNSDASLIIDDTLIIKVYDFIKDRITKDVIIADIEKELMKTLDSDIISINIRLVEDENITIIKYNDNSSRFIIKKKLTLTVNKLLGIIPDIKINSLTL